MTTDTHQSILSYMGNRQSKKGSAKGFFYGFDPEPRYIQEFLKFQSEDSSRMSKATKDMQKRLREALNTLIPRKQATTETDLSDRVWKLPATIPHILLFSGYDEQGNFEIETRFSSSNPFWLVLARCLEVYGSKLRRCEECDTVYLKVKKQKYCSSKCSQRVMARNFYKKHKEEIKAERRKAYLEEKRKKLGSKVKIREYRQYVPQQDEITKSITAKDKRRKKTTRRTQ